MTQNVLKGLACGCPHCASLLPFPRTLWRRGETFNCSHCDQRIVVPKVSVVLVIALLGGLAIFAKVVPWPVILTIIVGGLLLEWLLASAQPAPPDVAPTELEASAKRRKALEKTS